MEGRVLQSVVHILEVCQSHLRSAAGVVCQTPRGGGGSDSGLQRPFFDYDGPLVPPSFPTPISWPLSCLSVWPRGPAGAGRVLVGEDGDPLHVCS